MININIILIAMAFIFIVNICTVYKNGMVKQMISLISLIILGVTVVLIASGLSSYANRRFLNVVLVILLLSVLGIAKHILGVVFFSAKVLSKLPIVSWINKLLGVVFGALETVFFLWTLYTFVMMMDLGAIGNLILESTASSPILSWFYRNNYLAYFIENVASKLNFTYII